jgi:hypothetical protein
MIGQVPVGCDTEAARRIAPSLMEREATVVDAGVSRALGCGGRPALPIPAILGRHLLSEGGPRGPQSGCLLARLNEQSFIQD